MTPPRPRFSIAGLMALVVAVGLNLAAARWLVKSDLERALVFLPIGITLELAVVGLARGRGARRRFWAGYLVGGGIAMGSLVAAMLTAESPFWGLRLLSLMALEALLFGVLPIPRPSDNLHAEAVVGFIEQAAWGVLAGVGAVLIGRVARRPARIEPAPGGPA